MIKASNHLEILLHVLHVLPVFWLSEKAFIVWNILPNIMKLVAIFLGHFLHIFEIIITDAKKLLFFGKLDDL